MRVSSLNHLPRSTSLQRCEQNGPYFVSNQAPDFLQVGHLMTGFDFMFGSGGLKVAKAKGRFQGGTAAAPTRVGRLIVRISSDLRRRCSRGGLRNR
jgi:FAD synthase